MKNVIIPFPNRQHVMRRLLSAGSMSVLVELDVSTYEAAAMAARLSHVPVEDILGRQALRLLGDVYRGEARTQRSLRPGLRL